MPTDLEDTSSYPNLFAMLIQNGWTEPDLIKIANENIMRVFSDCENVYKIKSILLYLCSKKNWKSKNLSQRRVNTWTLFDKY